MFGAGGGHSGQGRGRAHGADDGIQYAREDLKERAKALTRGEGVNVVYDPVGGAHAEADIVRAGLVETIRCSACTASRTIFCC